MKKLLALLCLTATIFLSPAANAQITVTSGATAATLANTLVGTGVVVYGATLTCSTLAEGTFSGTSTLPFSSGVVLSSGHVSAIPAAASTFASTGYALPGDPQLTALAGLSTHDACILEFNFRPTGDTIKFDYVFGSEEWPEYACSSVNDVFGFFINGPGIPTAVNMALIPGTSIPVSINSVNPGAGAFGTLSNCTAMGPGSPFGTYYVNNAASTTIIYDGTTTLMTAIHWVTPCDTFHLKIGIADGGDDIYDSGVFLKAGSLSSTGVHITPVGMPGDTSLIHSQYAIRGCQPGHFVFQRSGSLLNPLTMHFTIGGSAVNGFDYSTIADSITIAPGDSLFTLMINPLLVPATGPKTVKLYLLSPYTCGTGGPIVVDSAILTILDSFFLRINTPDTAICLGQSVQINASADPLLHFTWSPAGTVSSDTALNPIATPITTTTYQITGLFPGCPSVAKHFTITVYAPPLLDIGAYIKNTCVGVAVPLNIIPTPSGSFYNFTWSPTTGLSSAVIGNPTVTASDSGNFMYYVTVGTPVAGCSSNDSFMLHVVPNDFTLFSQDTAVCYPPGSYQVRGWGSPEFTYSWTPNYNVLPQDILTPMVSPDATTVYTVTARYPGCPDMVHTIQYSIQHPQVRINMSDTTVCLSIPMHIPITVTPPDSPYTFEWTGPSGLVDPTIVDPFFIAPPGTYHYTLTVHSQLGCIDSDAINITTAPPVIIGITPGNTTIKLGDHVQLNTVNLGAPLPLIYMWSPNNGSLDNNDINNPTAAPEDSTTYFVYAMNQYGCRDTAQVVIDVDKSMSECIPSAFTPNGDGRNDEFKLLCNKFQKMVDFRVFNRWGQVVYENTSDPKHGWDGTFNGVPQDMGVYHYMITIARPDEVNIIYKGEVTLIR
jgi:gliding motility-associated-like protein